MRIQIFFVPFNLVISSFAPPSYSCSPPLMNIPSSSYPSFPPRSSPPHFPLSSPLLPSHCQTIPFHPPSSPFKEGRRSLALSLLGFTQPHPPSPPPLTRSISALSDLPRFPRQGECVQKIIAFSCHVAVCMYVALLCMQWKAMQKDPFLPPPPPSPDNK